MTTLDEKEYFGEDRWNRIADVAVKQQCSVRDVIRVLIDVHIGIDEVPIENVWGEGRNNPEKPVDSNQ